MVMYIISSKLNSAFSTIGKATADKITAKKTDACHAFVWNAITFLCGFLLLFCEVSPLCVVVTSLCCLVSLLHVVVTSLRFVVSSLCLVMQS